MAFDLKVKNLFKELRLFIMQPVDLVDLHIDKGLNLEEKLALFEDISYLFLKIVFTRIKVIKQSDLY